MCAKKQRYLMLIQHLCSDVFPELQQAKNNKTRRMKELAAELNISFGRFKNYYYKWRKYKDVDRLIDRRLFRENKTVVSYAASDYLVFLSKTINAKTAWRELKKSYERMGQELPVGFSYENIVRHLDKIKENEPSSIKIDRCRKCSGLYNNLRKTVIELGNLQKVCKDCEKML